MARGAIHTAREIAQQPAKWRELADMLRSRHADIQERLQDAFAHDELVIVFTGPGTSANAGSIAAAGLMAGGRRNAIAVPTTDIVDSHACFLDASRPTLLVSIARSGDSPESIAACRVVDTHVKTVWHVVLTCNEDGQLARLAHARDRLCLIMPKGTNDAGFAMTSSFSCLLLAALTVFEDDIGDGLARIEQSAHLAELIISRSEPIATLAQEDHDRAVYLGSGGLKAAAAESALKLLELTDGDVVATSETPLGFRHGPKAIVTAGKTLVLGYINGARPASAYGMDMLAEIHRDGKADVIAIGPAEAAGDPGLRRFAVETGGPCLPDSWLGVVYVTFAQMLGLFKSLHLGHRPDDPNPSGQINRVVQNVTIYLD